MLEIQFVILKIHFLILRIDCPWGQVQLHGIVLPCVSNIWHSKTHPLKITFSIFYPMSSFHFLQYFVSLTHISHC